MVKGFTETITLHNGVKMPWLGLGVWKMANDQEVINAVKSALEIGYRSIDTAAIYKNEEGVGRAIKESGVPREEIFLTTKVWNDDQGYDLTLQAFEDSRKRLGVDYVDLYLIHWPIARKYKDTWRAIEEIYEKGWARVIGVSNFHPHHLKKLMEDAKVKPMINQVELHPLLNQAELREFCKTEGIQMEAWSPFARGKLINHPVLKEIGMKYGKSPAQVIIRWDLQNGIVTIPKSSHADRIKQNGAVFDFTLTKEDMDVINGLNKNERVGSNPEKYDLLL